MASHIYSGLVCPKDRCNFTHINHAFFETLFSGPFNEELTGKMGEDVQQRGLRSDSGCYIAS